MLSHHWGIKTFYYSLINKQGAKAKDPELVELPMAEIAMEDDCESCKL